MLLHLTMTCMNCHEMSLLPGMHASLQSGDVLLADRGFCSFIHLALLSVFPMDAVFRMHQRVIVDFTPGRSHRGRSTGVVTIATTLLDPTRYPKSRIAELYGLRWEVETNFRHLKQTMNMDRLKSRSVDGILKELMIFVLVYNLIRCAMTLAAARQGVDVTRISFIDTMRWLCCGMTSGHRLPGDPMIELVVNPIRPGRYHPRVKKRRLKEYDLMNKSRKEYAKPSDDKGVVG